ncbi:hypothetical protein IPA_09175 [Ignicoccus pacificus DSM 13166]|uniref:Uncharacterized protein n=1 Tax=Ignicoccus pacificus DSM 13166 TaxID=940294 RepID=A0A977KDG5_9CREN|nr:hypothetical protein IPA_09175 [Ignicoccus pacificus DSM 13166]
MKSFICGQHRVLFIEGEDCNLVLIDVYSKGKGGETILESEEVKVTERKEEGGSIIGIEVEGKEDIFVKLCINREIDEKEAKELLLEAWKKLGLTLPREVECSEEQLLP